MAKTKVSIVDIWQNADISEQQEIVAAVKKKKKLWLILSLIPVVNFACGSFFIRNNNFLRVVNGKKPGGIVNILVMLWCYIIPPIIMNFICDRVLGEAFEENVILGCKEILEKHSKEAE